MTVEQLVYTILGAGVIVWICIRQLTWQRVSLSRMWRLPFILAIIGVFSMLQGSKHAGLTTLDITAIAVEVVVSLGIGALMGAIAVIRPKQTESRKRSNASRSPGGIVAGGRRPGRFADREDDDNTGPALETRTGWWGLALWVLLIAIRVGMDLAAQNLGAEVASSTGVILLIIAANRVARAAVFAYRIDQHTRINQHAGVGPRDRIGA